MSLYNMINGVNQVGVFFILPMIDKHPDDFKRFRDCSLGVEGRPEFTGKICVLTRLGGGNRESYTEEIKELTKMPTYITNFNWDVDETYAIFVYDVPEKWKDDFDIIYNEGTLDKLSEEYRAQIRKMYPTLAYQIDSLLLGLAELRKQKPENNELK